ncbi:MAG: hypothetical protein ACK5YS_05515 [bacterium]|jgi:hypothetical protein
MRLLVLILLVVSPLILSAQIKTPETPKFKKFSPTDNGGYYINSSSQTGNQYSTGQPSYPMGAHANDIIAQQNARAMQQMGYRPQVVPPSDPTLLAEFMRNQYNEYLQQTQQSNELLRELNELRNDELSRKNANYYTSEKFKTESASYWKAKALLDNMLSGKAPLSLKDAFYILENAYGNTHLSYAEYNSILKKSAQYIQEWLKEQGHNTTDNTALHFGIQAFMRDTLTISKLIQEPSGVSKTKHVPFTYDYIDFRAEEDFRNYFVTKTLATGTGQCNSLPTTYLLLAEQLGAKAYLSYAPLHSFIKFSDSESDIHNYEPTSHFELSDQWYVQHLKIRQEAYKSGIYLDTLNKKQIVAAAMLDLAYGYLRKHGVADGAFIAECVENAIQYFPSKVANVQGWLLRSTLLTAKLDRILQRDGIRDLKDIDKSPEGKAVYNQLKAIDQLLDELGYDELPTDVYKQLMQQQDDKGLKQKEITDTKTKHDLFISYK